MRLGWAPRDGSDARPDYTAAVVEESRPARPATGEPIVPIFLLSLPRSGSTALQRALSAHPDVGTASEPWLLLPLLYPLRAHGAAAEYDHAVMHQAIADLCRGLPDGAQSYRAAARRMALEIYRELAPEARYFVDKTPRYHLIADELFAMFPEAKFVLLWRNPLAVLASTVETWAGGRWSVHRWSIDLFEGVANLTSVQAMHGDRLSVIHYEDAVENPDHELARLFGSLGLDPVPGGPGGSRTATLGGALGDRRASEGAAALTDQGPDKWKAVLANPVRKAWARRYLKWIGRERLELMGYDLSRLLGELSDVRVSGRRATSDVVRLIRGRAVRYARDAAFRR